MKLAILIPAHNEAKAIGSLVSSLATMGYDCFVVDDGSVDGTGLVASKAGAIVFSTKRKSGKGAALRLGIAQLIKTDYEAILLMDGDGQHAPTDVSAFIQKADSSKADIINGNRLNNPQGMPKLRLNTNKFMSWLISMICRTKIDDTQCGFRLIRMNVLRAIDLKSNDFEIESEILFKSAKAGFKFASVDIQTIYRDEVSKINPVKDTVRFIRFLFKEMLGLR